MIGERSKPSLGVGQRTLYWPLMTVFGSISVSTVCSYTRVYVHTYCRSMCTAGLAK